MQSEATTAPDYSDPIWDRADKLDEVLKKADAKGLTPSAAARKAKMSTTEAFTTLKFMVAHKFARTSGNGAWTRYHAWR